MIETSAPTWPGRGLDTVPNGPTATARVEAVVRALTAMRERLGEPQSLRDLAQAAYLSPFHFHRVFHGVTSVTPGRFLAAVRMAEAKRLLVETPKTVTEISIAVGYSSFGTFTTQFTRLVGVPPGRFRAWAAGTAHLSVDELLEPLMAHPRPAGAGPRGWVSSRPDGSAGVTVLGLFRSGIPQDRPIDCVVAPAPARVQYGWVPRGGTGEVLAMSVAARATVGDVLTGNARQGLFVGATREPVPFGEDTGREEFLIRLREPRVTAPPVLIAVPLLATEARAAR